MPPANYPPKLERLARYAIVGLTLWMLGIGLWEIAAPFGAGHAAVLPARGIIADNMVHYGIGFPVRNYAAGEPGVEAAYAHHPFGTYYLFALMRLLFGRHEWAIRLVPVLVSAGMPALLFATARRLYGSIAGVAAALGWCVLPITLAFAQFPSFEMFSLAGMLLVTLAALRYQEEMSPRRLALLLAAVFIALNTDWTAFLFCGTLAFLSGAVVAFGPARATEQLPLRRLLQALYLVGAVIGATLLWYVVSLRQVGLFDDWLGSAQLRARGSEQPLLGVLAHRRYWIEVMFTKPGILLGLFGAVGFVVRLVVRRRFSESYPLLLLAVATIHYVYFKNGADVHVYWPLPFAGTFCLSLGVLVTALERLGPWVAARRGLTLAPLPATLAASGTCCIVALLILPDGLRALDYARDTGCRLNDDGQLNLQDYDKNLALSQFKSEVPAGKLVTLRESMAPNWSEDWALERPTSAQRGLGFSAVVQSPYVVFDVRFAPATASGWAVQSQTRVIGPYWFVNTERRSEEFVAYGFEERAPTLLERLFVQAHDPIRRVVEDPFRTWEYRRHLNIEPNPEPPGTEPSEHRRVWHNVLVSKGDLQGAARVQAELVAQLDQRSAREYQGGLRLIGHRETKGSVPRVEVYFLAVGSVGPDAFFDVRSRVLEAPPFSFVVKDDKNKKYGVGFEIHPSLWKAGYLYVSQVEVRGRPGVERFYGIWTGTQRPRPVDGPEEVPLFERR